MIEFKESKFYKLLQDFFINNDKETFLQMLAEFYNRTEGIINKNISQDELIKELRELYLEFNEKGIDENIVREKVNYFVENNVKIKDIIAKLVINTNKIENVITQIGSIKPYILNYVNIKTLGAKGDGVTDDTDIIENALRTYKYIYFPEGTYLITRPLTMEFGSVLMGDNPQVTILLCRNPKGTYAIKYGNEYNYNGYRGKICGIRFQSDLDINEKPFGIYLNSGMLIEDVDFFKMGKAIDRVSNYIDMITINRVYIGYCIPNGEYLIKLSGNADALKIDQLKIAAWDSDETEYNGIYIDRSHGGSITNSIINCHIRLEKCNGFSIENTHIETLTRQIQIIDSIVTLKDFFKWKNSNTNDIVISTTNYRFNSVINLKNVTFYTRGDNYELMNYAVSEIGEIPNNCQINFLNVVRQFNFADKNNTSMFTMGINIDNFDKFNLNSSQLSINGVIYPNKVIKTNIENEEFKPGTGFGTVATTNNITWKGDNSSLVYRYIGVVDETRKVISFYSRQSSSVVVNKGGEGVAIANNGDNITQSGFVLLARGIDTNKYNKVVKLPLNSNCRLLDNGISVNLFKWEDISESDVYNNYNQASKFFTINNGANAVVYMSTPPSKGIWTTGDRCINTNIESGQIKAWTYNGTQWISEGVY